MRKSWERVEEELMGDVRGKTKVMITLPPIKGWVPNHTLYNLSPKHVPRVYLSLPCVEAIFLLVGLHYINVHYDYLFIQHILKSLSHSFFFPRGSLIIFCLSSQFVSFSFFFRSAYKLNRGSSTKSSSIWLSNFPN